MSAGQGTVTRRYWTDGEIAAVCHQMNTGLQLVLGERISPPWNRLSQLQQLTVASSVSEARRGASDRELHELWRTSGAAPGHPNDVPWEELSPSQRIKDTLLRMVVLTMAGSQR